MSYGASTLYPPGILLHKAMNATELIQLATTAPSADNSQPWRFIADSGSLLCSYQHRSSARDPFGPLGHGTLMASGALLENLCTIQSEASTSIPEISINKSSWKITMPDIERWPEASVEKKRKLQGRHTNRHPFLGLPTSGLPKISDFGSSRAVALTSIEANKEIAKALTQCSIARFNCQELHEWLFSSLRWTSAEIESGTGLDINTLDLPPGGRHFMHWITPWPRMKALNHFGIAKILAAADASLVHKAPGIIAFIGGSEPIDIVKAGQLMQRTWLALNAQGIAVHPYYVLTDITNRFHNDRLDAQWRPTVTNAMATMTNIFDLHPEERIHMLFRVGLPTVTPVRARRLPVSSFLGN